jgi:hypothetical protein
MPLPGIRPCQEKNSVLLQFGSRFKGIKEILSLIKAELLKAIAL